MGIQTNSLLGNAALAPAQLSIYNLALCVSMARENFKDRKI